MLFNEKYCHKWPGFFFKRSGGFSSLSNELKKPVPFGMQLFTEHLFSKKNIFKNIIKAPV
jgi:hypothetical protein